MESGKMKNMVVLKNLPSNIVEEAIVILKSSKKVKKLEKIEKNNKTNVNEENNKKDKDYILKEAEMLVSNYISKLENESAQKTYKAIKTSKKYIRLRKYAYISSIVIIIQAILFIIK